MVLLYLLLMVVLDIALSSTHTTGGVSQTIQQPNNHFPVTKNHATPSRMLLSYDEVLSLGATMDNIQQPSPPPLPCPTLSPTTGKAHILALTLSPTVEPTSESTTVQSEKSGAVDKDDKNTNEATAIGVVSLTLCVAGLLIIPLIVCILYHRKPECCIKMCEWCMCVPTRVHVPPRQRRLSRSPRIGRNPRVVPPARVEPEPKPQPTEHEELVNVVTV